ncbi:hypothetical protein H112_08599 [Trichophyton rubrum D6]|uniref:Uncharacterized protein n=2 Tax=Trichophyton TaxID=5550 RepID=A0A022VMV9_TRIRU|nr:hypothetical protein H100_08621 [Trichophyton rubrum MR850]EZF36986.1 hypothetical protein H102_08580 [Trichophyton rubrum CBS 100081]EZF47602.1 hypothetical protein H103_08603 [Trichophyton rubrum CBS 288.86]EZF58278.1 hypothetical protein H104_08555 [Trichophyton rubrum CBS 289.86]EZF68824.1 hypothetical protein H105_08608 [Trichophyton soudanense CBS 452.61]EZF79499.1 hypothetical protein H110_08604 [Trichophyton rubrum MR1448]EZF90028.1 hypothetical protein H113_08672 [Trichophyton rub
MRTTYDEIWLENFMHQLRVDVHDRLARPCTRYEVREALVQALNSNAFPDESAAQSRDVRTGWGTAWEWEGKSNGDPLAAPFARLNKRLISTAEILISDQQRRGPLPMTNDWAYVTWVGRKLPTSRGDFGISKQAKYPRTWSVRSARASAIKTSLPRASMNPSPIIRCLSLVGWS